MCGITGFYSKNNSFTKEDLLKMTLKLSHRGPDAEGFYFDNQVGLGHRRLSILDLSESANQPMFSQNDRYIIVFNGEVYNFREIAKELDCELKTTSDTEVILEAFVKFGANFVHKLNGMFAIVIFDKEEENLYIYRDRMGVKPIFYFYDGVNFAFASEIKSLLAINYIVSKKELNFSAINKFLHLGYIPEPETIYQNIHKFPAGHTGIFKNNSLKLESYWEFPKKVQATKVKDFKEAKAELKNLLISSVQYRLISDVPFGIFLSGGIDSSLISAIASKEINTKVKTFSIGFQESKYNESKHAKAVSEYLGTEHHEFIVYEKDAIALFDDLDDIYDEPFADHSAIPTLLVSKLARKHVKMTLSGDGADELFLGYGSYKWARRLSKPFLYSMRKPISQILDLGSNRYKRISNLFKIENKEKLKNHIFSQEYYYFSEKEISKVLSKEVREITFREEKELARELDPMEMQALFDMQYYLKDDLLAKVDRATMAASLETRVPFLDYRIVEYALNLDSSLKIHNNTGKYIIKEILYDYIPSSYFDRPKWGFAVPLELWLKKDLKYLIDEYLSTEMIKKMGILNVSEVESLKYKFFNGHSYLFMRLWVLIILQKFLSKFNKT